MRKIGTREFLRHINDMNEPAVVSTHSKFKGVWIPVGSWTPEALQSIWIDLLVISVQSKINAAKGGPA